MGALPFWTLDVFTDHRFAGNPLAVVGEAGGLDAALMQRTAAEFNLSETVFLVEENSTAGRAAVRIFTPRAELPFAGHPTIGTALLLARRGFGERDCDDLRLLLDMPAGTVPITVTQDGGYPVRAQFTAPGAPQIGDRVDAAPLLALLGLEAADLAGIAPGRAGHGLDFMVLELGSIAALGRARHIASAELVAAAGIDAGIYLFTRATDDGSIRARMFDAAHGIAEDPATGSAAAALATLLAHHDPALDLHRAWRIVQGVEMNRPSTIDITAVKRAGRIAAVTVAGGAVPVTSGRINVQP